MLYNGNLGDSKGISPPNAIAGRKKKDFEGTMVTFIIPKNKAGYLLGGWVAFGEMPLNFCKVG